MMDTSETYIKMCEKAGEIQPLRPTMCEGDFFSDICNDYSVDCYERGVHLRECEIWLPRQDQLQEMLQPIEPRTLYILIELFLKFVRKINYTTSMEQLWLAFVMKERWNKVWNGEVWNDTQNH